MPTTRTSYGKGNHQPVFEEALGGNHLQMKKKTTKMTKIREETSHP